MNYPKDATHFHLFYNNISFWKIGDDYYSWEANKQYFRWHSFDFASNKWIKEYYVSSRNFIKLENEDQIKDYLKEPSNI